MLTRILKPFCPNVISNEELFNRASEKPENGSGRTHATQESDGDRDSLQTLYKSQLQSIH